MTAQTAVKDGQLFLRTRLRAMVLESKLVRDQIQKAKKARTRIKTKYPESDIGDHPEVIHDLIHHRRFVLRRTMREMSLALAALRGRTPYAKIESRSRTRPDWACIRTICTRFGSYNGGYGFSPELSAQVDAWIANAEKHWEHQHSVSRVHRKMMSLGKPEVVAAAAASPVEVG